MPEIYVTPCDNNDSTVNNFLRKLLLFLFFRKKISAERTRSGRLTLREQIIMATQMRQEINSMLAFKVSNDSQNINVDNMSMPISEVLEDMSRNISKMDQNLYSAKVSMEEVIRSNAGTNESVSFN